MQETGFIATLPAPTATLAGCMWLPRLLHKARASLAGTLPPNFAAVLCHPRGVDGQFLAAFGLDRAAVLDQARRPGAEDADWFLALPEVTPAAIAAWNAQAPQLGSPGHPLVQELAWACRTFRPDLDPAAIPSVFALLELDEGRGG